LEQLQYHAQKHKKRINQLETNDEAYRLTMIARDETIVKLEEQKQDLTQKLTDESIIKDTELEKLTEEIKNLKTEKDGTSNKQENDKNEINNLKGHIKVQKKRIITTF
jgi:predicted  nucleic acid-binding Zn-ribbon protein